MKRFLQILAVVVALAALMFRDTTQRQPHSNFTIKRSDFGINPGAPQDKVSDEIALMLSVAGASPN